MSNDKIKSAVGRGMAVAATVCIKGFGEDVVAQEILSAAGYKTADQMRKDEISEYDIEACQHLLSN